MEKYVKTLLVPILLGLIVGFALSQVRPEGQCERAEKAIIEESNVSGAVACFKPGVVPVNLSEGVENSSSLECVCRRSFEGRVDIWTINRAGN